jgi:hypothetical protein
MVHIYDATKMVFEVRFHKYFHYHKPQYSIEELTKILQIWKAKAMA